MARTVDISPLKLKLGHQGLLFVSVLLLFEFFFVGSLYQLLHQAELEAQKEEHSKEIIGKTNRLLQLFFTAGGAIEKFAQTNDPAMRARYQAAAQQGEETMRSLQADLAQEPEELAQFRSIAADFRSAISISDQLLTIIDQRGPLKALAYVQKKQETLAPLIKSVVPRLMKLVESEKRIEMESPAAQRSAREKSKELLVAGLAVNVLFAVMLAWFFTRNITSKLDVLVDNTLKMRAGKPLNAVLIGRDEISQLDAVFHDMAESLRREEEKLRVSEARVRSIIEKMPIGLILTTQAGLIVFVNPATEKMFACSSSALLEKHLYDLFAEAESLDLTKSMNKIKELTARRGDGSSFPVEFSLADFNLAEGPRLLAIILDITERYEIQKLRQSFVSMVSHELRTPLSSVRGYLTLINVGAFGQLPGEAMEGADRAEKNIVRLIGLINDLLDLEKTERGHLTINRALTPASAMVMQAVDAVSELAAEHGITIEAAQSDAELFADHGRIVQVLVNLLSNAIKFSPAKSAIAVSVKKIEEMIEFRISDKGRGIPERMKESIFERFQQVEESDSRQKGGTGLGLAIAKAIVEQHGGTIGVDSEEGKGSSFWFRLPESLADVPKQEG